MDLYIDDKKFSEVMNIVRNAKEAEGKAYISEVLKIKETFNVILKLHVDKDELKGSSLPSEISNFMQHLNVDTLEVVHKIRKEGDCFTYEVFSNGEDNEPDITLNLYNDCTFEVKENLSLLKKCPPEYKEVFETKLKDIKNNSVFTVIGIGKILYDINNKLVVQKIKIKQEIIKKKVKKSGSKKKITKDIVVNKPIIEYTGIPTEKGIQRKDMKFTLSSWESRGYWRTNGKTKKKEWVTGSTKKRKCANMEEKEVKRQKYVYK